MHAILRLNSFDEAKFAGAGDDLRNFNELHAAQPGFVGTMTVDLGGGRRITLNLWRSPQDAEAALAVLGPEVRRVLEPLMSSPSQLIGAGTVVGSDFIPTHSSPGWAIYFVPGVVQYSQTALPTFTTHVYEALTGLHGGSVGDPGVTRDSASCPESWALW